MEGFKGRGCERENIDLEHVDTMVTSLKMNTQFCMCLSCMTKCLRRPNQQNQQRLACNQAVQLTNGWNFILVGGVS